MKGKRLRIQARQKETNTVRGKLKSKEHVMRIYGMYLLSLSLFSTV